MYRVARVMKQYSQVSFFCKRLDSLTKENLSIYPLNLVITTLIKSNNLLIIQCQVIKSPPNGVTCLLCLRHNVVSGHNSQGMAIITGSSYLQAGLLKCPLLNTTPLKGAENWRLTIMPVFSQVTSRPVICGILAGPPWAPVTPPSMRRLWRRD